MHIARKIDYLYQSTPNTKLVSKMAVFMLIEKLYRANRYVNRAYVSESRLHKIKVVSAPNMSQKVKDDQINALVCLPPTPTTLPAVFPGGSQALQAYIMDNTVYPVKAADKGLRAQY